MSGTDEAAMEPRAGRAPAVPASGGPAPDGAAITERAPIGNVVDYLFERALEPENADRAAMILDQEGSPALSFRELYGKVCQAGNALAALGIAPGDRVMISVMDGPDFVALFLGGMAIGAITIPINPWLKPGDYRYYVNDSGARAVVVDRSLAPLFAELRADLPAVEHILVAGERASAGASGFPFLDEALAAQPETLAIRPADPDDMAFWLYSSGSTGDPKGVVHTHAHIYWATELFGIAEQRIEAGDVVLCPPKMFFAYGLGNQVYFPLRCAATNVINATAITPRKIWDLWLAHEPTIVMSVPTLFAGMLQLAQTEIGQERVRQACRRMRFAVSGGEMLPPSLFQRWRDYTGIEILDGVGTTEMTHMFMINRPGDVVPGSCGKLSVGFAAEILDEDGNRLPDGEVGNLHVYGPSAAREYWNKPERTQAVFGRGGVLTGDKFHRDAQGNYFLVGRTDDMLRVGGIWVSPTEIEAALAEHDTVLECAVVGAPDEQEMVKPMAFVVLKDGAPEDADAAAEELRAFVRARLAHYKCPRWIRFVDDLPKTTTGKIQRFRLRGEDGADGGRPERNEKGH